MQFGHNGAIMDLLAVEICRLWAPEQSCRENVHTSGEGNTNIMFGVISFTLIQNDIFKHDILIDSQVSLTCNFYSCECNLFGKKTAADTFGLRWKKT